MEMLLFLTLRYIKAVSIFFHFLNPFTGYINFVTYRGEKMKVSNISSELKFVNRLGVTLSVEERISIEAQALRLSHEYKHDQWNFWGRIEGIVKNYYIIEGVDFKGVTNFPNRQYFWANDDFKFAELPAPRQQYTPQVDTLNDFFSGQHERILFKNSNQAPKVLRGVNGEQMIVKQKNFTELDRLSLVVSLVSHDCSVVPLGAYIMIPTHELVANPDFTGLKIKETKNGENYVHLRAPEDQDKKILIQCDKSLERNDFMDSIANDKIKQSWSIQTDESGTQITIRSLLWPGYAGYHRTNSSIFGGAYMGTGIRCHDLPFLL